MQSAPLSTNGIPIRLTEERWSHIVEEHPELTPFRNLLHDVITVPNAIYEGSMGELLGLKEVEPGKNLIVVYKELPTDGFVITAFFSRRTRFLEKRKKIWEQPTSNRS